MDVLNLYYHVIVLYYCIELYYCFYPLQCTVSTGLFLFSSPTCLLVFGFASIAGRTIYLYCCVLLLVTLNTDIDIPACILSASTIVGDSRLCPHSYKCLLS